MTNPSASDWRQIGDTTVEVYRAELGGCGSPMAAEADAIWEAARPHSALCLAMSFHEQKHATWPHTPIPRHFHNPLSLSGGWDHNANAHAWKQFRSWADGVRAWRENVTNPNGPYKGTRTLEELIHVYAPAEDNNDEAQYVAVLRDQLQRYQAQEGTKQGELEQGTDKGDDLGPVPAPANGVRIGNRPLHIAVGVGHANTSGGDPFEREKNAEVVNALMTLARQSDGFEIRCYTPEEGLGWYPGPLDKAAREVTAMGDWVDIFHEVHHQGLSNQSIRGGFVIGPEGRGLKTPYDNPGSIDLDVRDHGPRMAEILCASIGVPVWGGGYMSERNTGVGGQGHRLGVFGATATPHLINRACRFITEACTFTNPEDRAIMNTPASARGRRVASSRCTPTWPKTGWAGPTRTESVRRRTSARCRRSRSRISTIPMAWTWSALSPPLARWSTTASRTSSTRTALCPACG